MQLAQNVKRALADFPALKIHADRDRMHILLNGEDSEEVIPKLSKSVWNSKFFAKYSY